MQPTYRWRRDPGTHGVPFRLPAATRYAAEHELAVGRGGYQAVYELREPRGQRGDNQTAGSPTRVCVKGFARGFGAGRRLR